MTVQRLTDVLQRGPPEQRQPTLLLLRCLLEAPELRLGPAALYPATLFAPVATLLHGPCAADALQVGFRVLTLSSDAAPRRDWNLHRCRVPFPLIPSTCAAQVLEALMRCSSAHTDQSTSSPANTPLPPAVPEPDQAVRRAGLGPLERVVGFCPGVPRPLPVAARAEASDF